MKEQVQSAGVRQWFGDDYINLQNEIIESVGSIISGFGNCILKGCTISSNTISSGIVYLLDSTGANGKICRVNQGSVTSFPAYIVQRKYAYPEVQAYGRQYKDASIKGIIEEYIADIVYTLPSHSNYILIEASNTENAKRTFKSLATDTATQILDKLKTVDGLGSELDADLVDGIHFRINSGKLQFSTNGTTWTTTTMDASAILAALLTVDGINSDLDADYLRGIRPAIGAEVNTIAMRDSNGALNVTDIIIL
jgi:hypothetical protein